MKDRQTQDKAELIERGDKVVARVPGIEHPITINEIHALQLGVAGLLAGIGYTTGYRGFAAGASILLVTYAILGFPVFQSMNHDNPKYKKTIGMRTIKHEPWWFISSYMAFFALAILLL